MNRKDRRAEQKRASRGGARGEIEHLLATAQRRHQAGNLAEAARLYERILRTEPRHAPSLYLSGILAHQSGQGDAALDRITRAIAIDGQVAEWHHDRGLVLLALRRTDEAAACFHEAIRL